MAASNSEIKMYNDKVLSWKEILHMMAVKEARCVFLYIRISVCNDFGFLLFWCGLCQIFGNSPTLYDVEDDWALWYHYWRSPYSASYI